MPALIVSNFEVASTTSVKPTLQKLLSPVSVAEHPKPPTPDLSSESSGEDEEEAEETKVPGGWRTGGGRTGGSTTPAPKEAVEEGFASLPAAFAGIREGDRVLMWPGVAGPFALTTGSNSTDVMWSGLAVGAGGGALSVRPTVGEPSADPRRVPVVGGHISCVCVALPVSVAILSGASGPSARFINGVFSPTGEEYNGKPLFRKVVDPDKWLRCTKTGFWVVTDTASKEANDGSFSNQPFGAPQSAGKFVTTVEQQHSYGQRTGTLEYMSITCTPAFKSQSFEEIRLQVTQHFDILMVTCPSLFCGARVLFPYEG
jgi:hypothetical protein